MIWWNAIFEIEKIEKLSLIARLPTHHDPPPPPNESRSNRESCPSANHEPFFDSIDSKLPHKKGALLDSYLEPSFFEMMPSKPSRQTCWKATSAAASIGCLIRSPAQSVRSSRPSASFRFSIGSPRRSSPSSSRRSNA